VLLQGESGTGKERIARYIHASSRRRHGPFLAINCSAVPEALMESELFGAVRGSYTGAVRDRAGLFRIAHGGTLLLDEVGDMPPSMQAKLLRVLQERTVRPVGSASEETVDVRVVSASHRNLQGLVGQGRFRLDLFYRIAVMELTIPPLRDRLSDIPHLVEHLCVKLETSSGLGPVEISRRALDLLGTHPWPGNIRELESVLARSWLNADGPVIHAPDIDLPPDRSRPLPQESPAEPLERWMIRRALADTEWNVTAAAFRIGWTRQKLYRKMRDYSLKK
jgi:transcriptional regulator with PAS, ATPase and Fis domain